MRCCIYSLALTVVKAKISNSCNFMGSDVASFFAKPIFWKAWVRIPLFGAVWMMVGSIVLMLVGSIAPTEFISIAADAFAGNRDRISTPEFAYTLSFVILALAIGLLIAHFVCDMLLVRLALRGMRGRLAQLSNSRDLAAQRDRLRNELGVHPLLGHAWKEFDETLVPHNDGLHNTIRPQVFFNISTIKEKISGLKWQSAEPGYFVGTGLLLTFIGLVIALSKAAASTSAQDAGVMRHALEELLNAATFKFATSIAGLSASIFLSLFYRAFTIGIESSLHRFCEAVESKVLYLPPQSVSVAMRDHLADQLTQLKEINSEAFFSKLGTEVAPRMQEAFARALVPFAEKIGGAVGQMNANSQNGVQELLDRFTATLQSGAGTEMRELANSLHALLPAMEKVRADMGRSGDDFSQKTTDAAENLKRLVAEAGQQLGAQSQTSRETLGEMLASLQTVFQQATNQIDSNLKWAAEGASTKLTEAMEKILQGMENHISSANERFEEASKKASEYFEATKEKIAEAQRGNVDTISLASAKAAEALGSGLGEAMKTIRGEVEGFSSALRQSAISLDGQAKAIDAAASKSREVAVVFGQSAEAMRAAIDPVARSNEKIAQVASAVGTALQQAGDTMSEGQKAAQDLTEEVRGQVQRLTALWADYHQRFAEIDEKLAVAFEKLGAETTNQSQILANRTGEIDQALANSVERLDRTLRDLAGSAEDMSDGVDQLKKLFAANAASH